MKHIDRQYGSRLVLNNLTPDEMDYIKKRLTFNNPQYTAVKKYSRNKYTNITPHLFYYTELGHDSISVPIGFDLGCIPNNRFNKDIKDSRSFPDEINYPDFKLELREDQKEAAISFLKNRHITTPIKGIIQLPTGKGKSILGIYIARALETKTLIIVHKNDLVKGWQEDIKLAFEGKVTPGLIKAKTFDIGEQITIATVQTLSQMDGDERLDKLFSEFGFIIQDEMHHSPSRTFSISSHFKARYRLGLTATPERKDGLAHVMQLYFGDFCYRYKYDAQDEDVLPVEVVKRDLDVYFDPVCEYFISTKRYVIKDLYATRIGYGSEPRLSEIPHAQRPKVPYHTIDDYVIQQSEDNFVHDVLYEYNQGHSCIVFFTQKEHCKLFYEKLIGRQCVLYYGDNTDAQNNSSLELAKTIRKLVTVTTYAKATEGTNCPQWEVAFLCSSINDEKNTEQAIGRIRRTMKDGEKINPVRVYDYRYPNVYSFRSHGNTRDNRYKALKFINKGESKKMFSRGFN